ncbi:hypothetical protein MKZ38_001455 [Zalerion maritima]|uniref:NADH dehydrogenase [ubiquinone] 1 alpha subcomplex subunit 1 n=1 Tax=Zalerion maritima TaxID=339359 RepID=A0AAD5WX03_9PEZI|nr:hypothetical protein MKZ38_001455 [Zalerion maritima]
MTISGSRFKISAEWDDAVARYRTKAIRNELSIEYLHVFPSTATELPSTDWLHSSCRFPLRHCFLMESAFSLAGLKGLQNGGKRARRGLDIWDKQMMERDRRLTGFHRGQTDKPIAPLGFELNNPWKCEDRIV